jgi:uncharacterized protein YcbX
MTHMHPSMTDMHVAITDMHASMTDMTGLCTLQASMTDLNTRIPGGLSVNRFRGNLIIDGEAAWTEDSWGAVDIVSAASPDLAPISLVNVKPCERCKVW